MSILKRSISQPFLLAVTLCYLVLLFQLGIAEDWVVVDAGSEVSNANVDDAVPSELFSTEDDGLDLPGISGEPSESVASTVTENEHFPSMWESIESHDACTSSAIKEAKYESEKTISIKRMEADRAKIQELTQVVSDLQNAITELRKTASEERTRLQKAHVDDVLEISEKFAKQLAQLKHENQELKSMYAMKEAQFESFRKVAIKPREEDAEMKEASVNYAFDIDPRPIDDGVWTHLAAGY